MFEALLVVVLSAAPAIEGTWSSPACESTPDGSMHFTRTFKIDKGAWAIDFSTYGDAACKEKMVTVDIDGPYKLEKPSPKVKGATEAQFLFTRRKATPKSEGAAKWLSSVKACGKADWKAGESVDIDASGCPQLGAYPKAQCAGEFDLVKVEGDQLFFGARPADGNLCSKEKRPAQLGAPVKKS